jgi:hypothetical protein
MHTRTVACGSCVRLRHYDLSFVSMMTPSCPSERKSPEFWQNRRRAIVAAHIYHDAHACSPGSSLRNHSQSASIHPSLCVFRMGLGNDPFRSLLLLRLDKHHLPSRSPVPLHNWKSLSRTTKPGSAAGANSLAPSDYMRACVWTAKFPPLTPSPIPRVHL